MMFTVTKTPAAILNYGFDWSDWLASDTIASVVWTVETGVTVESQSNDATSAQVLLSGGELGSEYTVACRVTTAAGLVDERAMLVRLVKPEAKA